MRSSSVGASSGIALTFRVSAACASKVLMDRVKPTANARVRVSMKVLRFIHYKIRRCDSHGR
ncbi:hypothetical protein D3C84_1043630 [compost metagenome]